MFMIMCVSYIFSTSLHTPVSCSNDNGLFDFRFLIRGATHITFIVASLSVGFPVSCACRFHINRGIVAIRLRYDGSLLTCHYLSRACVTGDSAQYWSHADVLEHSKSARCIAGGVGECRAVSKASDFIPPSLSNSVGPWSRTQ